jgi:hypothetical protein
VGRGDERWAKRRQRMSCSSCVCLFQEDRQCQSRIPVSGLQTIGMSSVDMSKELAMDADPVAAHTKSFLCSIRTRLYHLCRRWSCGARQKGRNPLCLSGTSYLVGANDSGEMSINAIFPFVWKMKSGQRGKKNDERREIALVGTIKWAKIARKSAKVLCKRR